jgi:hypothetical protein
MLNRFWKGAAALVMAALASCGVQAAEPRPAMWKLADKDTTIYLFGTIHMLPEGRAWRTPAFEAALASADELVLEIAKVDDEMATAQTMMKLGLGKGLPPLRERVPAGKRPALESMAAESGVPMALLDRLDTWAAALSLLGVTFKRLGLDPSLGVEERLTSDWKKRKSGKPVTGLETIEQQLGFFDTLDEAQQRTFLLGVLDDPADAKAQFQAMVDAWASGDEKAIARTFEDEQNLTPELRSVLLGRRNAKWAEWLDSRMDRPGTVFVAVGAGHLAGKDSVQKMLKKRGFKAKRVQ